MIMKSAIESGARPSINMASDGDPRLALLPLFGCRENERMNVGSASCGDYGQALTKGYRLIDQLAFLMRVY